MSIEFSAAKKAAMIDPGAKIYPVVSQPICQNANNSKNPEGTGNCRLLAFRKEPCGERLA
jgi:hypothetical protein